MKISVRIDRGQDLGVMGWTPPGEMRFQINKTNTWDDAPPGLFGRWEDATNPDKAESFTSLRSCGQLSIQPGLPVFDWMYLEDTRSSGGATGSSPSIPGTSSCHSSHDHGTGEDSYATSGLLNPARCPVGRL